MTRIAYINGRFIPAHQAVTSIEDRGYNFADGVYEYCAFYNRKILDEAPHLARLEASLAKLHIPLPMSMRALSFLMNDLIARNTRDEGGLYLQITRGIARRDHPFPKGARPVLAMMLYAAKNAKPYEREKGARVISAPDLRWKRCDVKSLSLLPNVLAKQTSVEAGAREAWLVLENGVVTEGTASNAYIVKNGAVITHPADHHILGGITRDVVLRIARAQGIRVEERPFTLAEAKAADEAFLTSTSPNVLPVVHIDDTAVGTGKPGPITAGLMKEYHAHIHAQTGKVF